MNYSTNIEFLKKVLEQYRLNLHQIYESQPDYANIDKGVRQYLGLNNLYELTADLMKDQLTPNTIYSISDEFISRYFVMEIPNKDERCFLTIGPYTEHNLTQSELLLIAEEYKIPDNIKDSMLQYYINIPFIADSSPIRIVLSAFYETIWGIQSSCMFKEVQYNLVEQYATDATNTLLENFSEATDLSFKMKLLEERYQIEASLMKYVSQGNYNKAIATLSGLNMALVENRADTRLRDYKNYSIVLNTLLRKGAEIGLVHPIHIDKLSSHYARKIETITSLEQGKTLLTEMIRKYCLLVKNHSLKAYSLLIQKVITRIDTDLTLDHSLKTYAELLSVHPSYLSSLFRKETGVTLTEYVNQKRVEHGVFLLNTTNMQIQTIAQQCGVSDINYFTRIFKKRIGKTPSEYKNSLG